jgi:hypothetical protein
LLGGRVACASSSSSSSPSIHGTIAFATVGRVKYAFDIYTVQVPSNLHSISLSHDVPAVAEELLQETLLTDGVSVNSNGHLITPTSSSSSSSSSFAPLLKHLDICSDDEEEDDNNNNLCSEATRDDVLAFVSERDGSAQIYFRFLRTHNSQGEEKSQTLKLEFLLGVFFKCTVIFLSIENNADAISFDA